MGAVQKIERIEHKVLWMSYWTKRMQVSLDFYDRRNPEAWVFHGSRVAMMNEIMNGADVGFSDPSCKFSVGFYGAADIRLSLAFCEGPTNPDGLGIPWCARPPGTYKVVLWRVIKGRSKTIQPIEAPEGVHGEAKKQWYKQEAWQHRTLGVNDKGEAYHSAMNPNRTELIVKQNNDAYPAYLITFRIGTELSGRDPYDAMMQNVLKPIDDGCCPFAAAPPAAAKATAPVATSGPPTPPMQSAASATAKFSFGREQEDIAKVNLW